MRLIDLTHTFEHNMPVYPGDPESKLTQIADIENDGFTDHKLCSALHVGTHMDAPLHMIENGKKISEIAMGQFIGNGHLVDARDCSEVTADLLKTFEVGKGDIVLVHTGYAEKFKDEDYYETYPELTEDFARSLVDLGVDMVCLDTPSPDKPPFPVHKILLGAGILIVENVTNLDLLSGLESFQIIALPMKLKADAAPVRVIALTDDAS